MRCCVCGRAFHKVVRINGNHIVCARWMAKMMLRPVLKIPVFRIHRPELDSVGGMIVNVPTIEVFQRWWERLAEFHTEQIQMVVESATMPAEQPSMEHVMAIVESLSNGFNVQRLRHRDEFVRLLQEEDPEEQP